MLTWVPGQPNCGGIFDFDQKKERLTEVAARLEDPDIWNDAKRAQDLGREKKQLEATVGILTGLDTQLRDLGELFALARDESDDATLLAIEPDVAAANRTVAGLEFQPRVVLHDLARGARRRPVRTVGMATQGFPVCVWK